MKIAVITGSRAQFLTFMYDHDDDGHTYRDVRTDLDTRGWIPDEMVLCGEWWSADLSLNLLATRGWPVPAILRLNGKGP